jgi:hypothetical protein
VQEDVIATETTLGISEGDTTPVRASLGRRAWEGWKRIAHKIGVFQTRVIMTIFYFLLVLPLGLILRVVRDPLNLKHPEGTNWVPHHQEPHNLETASRQF